jgi:hypothetical protein
MNKSTRREGSAALGIALLCIMGQAVGAEDPGSLRIIGKGRVLGAEPAAAAPEKIEARKIGPAPAPAKPEASAQAKALLKELEDSGELEAALERMASAKMKRKMFDKQDIARETVLDSMKAAQGAGAQDPGPFIAGPPGARFQVRIWADMSSPVAGAVFRDMHGKLGAQKDIALVVHPASNGTGPGSIKARAAQCAGAEGGAVLWKYLPGVFDAQGKDAKDLEKALLAAAGKAGIKDMGKFSACLATPKGAGLEEGKRAAALGARALPYVVLVDAKEGQAFTIPGLGAKEAMDVAAQARDGKISAKKIIKSLEDQGRLAHEKARAAGLIGEENKGGE